MFDVWIRILHTGGTRAYSLVVSLAALAITARWLGPSGRGEMAAAIAWATVFFTVGSLSLSMPVIHRAGTATDDSWRGETVGTLVGFNLLTSAVIWCIAGVLYLLTHGRAFGSITASVLIIALINVPFLMWEQFGNNVLLSVNRLDIANRATIAGKTVYLLLLLASWRAHLSLHYAFVAMILGQATYAVLTLGYLRTEIGGIRFSKRLLVELLPDALRFHASVVAVLLQTSSGVLIINWFMSAAQTGYYQLAVQLIDVTLVLPYAAMAVLYAKLSEVGSQNLWSYQRQLLVRMIALMTLVAIVAAVASPYVIPVVAGRAFAPAVRVFQWLLCGVILSTVTAVMTPQWVARGIFGRFAALSVTTCVITLAATYLLTLRFGVAGAAAAALLSMALTATANTVLAVSSERRYRRAAVSS